MTTKPDIAAIRARIVAATPWEFVANHCHVNYVQGIVTVRLCMTKDMPGVLVCNAILQFLNHAKSDITALLAENEGLEKRVAELESSELTMARTVERLGICVGEQRALIAELGAGLKGTLGLIRRAQETLCSYLIPDSGQDDAETLNIMLEMFDGPTQREIESKARTALTPTEPGGDKEMVRSNEPPALSSDQGAEG